MDVEKVLLILLKNVNYILASYNDNGVTKKIICQKLF